MLRMSFYVPFLGPKLIIVTLHTYLSRFLPILVERIRLSVKNLYPHWWLSLFSTPVITNTSYMFMTSDEEIPRILHKFTLLANLRGGNSRWWQSRSFSYENKCSLLQYFSRYKQFIPHTNVHSFEGWRINKQQFVTSKDLWNNVSR